MSWKCKCSWENNDPSCEVCGARRPWRRPNANVFAVAAKPQTEEDEARSEAQQQVAQESLENAAVSLTGEVAADGNANDECRGQWSLSAARESGSSIEASPAAEASVQAIKSSLQPEEEHVASDNHTDDRNADQWDAFAALQENYESSDDESEEESRSDEGVQDGNGQQKHNEQQWNAFESLENNYQSSSEDDSELESDDGSDCEEQSVNQENGVECIDLLDSSDEEEKITNLNNQHELVDSDEDHEPLRKRRRITKISDHFKPKSKVSKTKSKSKESPIILDDSSISEEESPTMRGAQHSINQPWQRSVRLETITQQSRSSARSTGSQLRRSIPRGSTLPLSSFTCMNGRNDIRGGGGAGVNGVNLQAQGDEDERKKRSRVPDKAKSTKKRTTKGTKKATAKKTTRKRASAKTSEDGDEKPKTRRRRGWGRKGGRRARSSYTNGRSYTRSNNAWSARERGIRNNRNNCGLSPYMSIRNQDSGLGNIGGADVRF